MPLDIKSQPIPLIKRETTSLHKRREVPSEMELEKTRLKKATEEFESFFFASMLKSMRSTIPKSESGDQGMAGSLGKDIFQSMFDQELAKKMAERSVGGVGDILYQNLVKRIENIAGNGLSDTKVKLKMIRPETSSQLVETIRINKQSTAREDESRLPSPLKAPVQKTDI